MAVLVKSELYRELEQHKIRFGVYELSYQVNEPPYLGLVGMPWLGVSAKLRLITKGPPIIKDYPDMIQRKIALK